MRDPNKDVGLLWQRHVGERILVCGLGPSLELYHEYLERDYGNLPITIGVNDVGRHFNPDYLVLVDQPAAFNPRTHHRDGALEQILNSRPKVATVVNDAHHERWEFLIGERHHKVVAFVPASIPAMAGLPVPHYKGRPHWHIHTGGGGSPMTAASLAGFLGAKSIGVIGVDLIDHPRVRQQQFGSWNYVWHRLADFLATREIEIVNLSPHSKLTDKVPKMPLEDWLAGATLKPEVVARKR